MARNPQASGVASDVARLGSRTAGRRSQGRPAGVVLDSAEPTWRALARRARGRKATPALSALSTRTTVSTRRMPRANSRYGQRRLQVHSPQTESLAPVSTAVVFVPDGCPLCMQIFSSIRVALLLHRHNPGPARSRVSVHRYRALPGSRHATLHSCTSAARRTDGRAAPLARPPLRGHRPGKLLVSYTQISCPLDL